jgi:beta-lactamase superfamily II metal-dependent hydrolase
VQKNFRIAAIFTIILSLVLTTSYFSNDSVVKAAGPYLTVHVLDVDDSGYIIELPDGKIMVVDAGRSSELTKVENKLNALGITKIDYLVGTHEHTDHIANFDSLINDYTIGGVYFPDAPAPCNNTVCNDMKTAASNNGVTIHYMNAGQRIFPTTTVNGLTLSTFVFAPHADDDYSAYYTEGSTESINSYSMVLDLVYGSKKILFTGDIYPEAQDVLTSNYTLGGHNIITAPHHGYGGTNQASFLDYMEAAGTSKIIIDNQKGCGTVVDFKYLLQTRGTSKYWSIGYNHDFYQRTDGINWSTDSTAEWSPGDPVVVPPVDHSCP